MDEFWGVAVPNWITAIATVIALLAAGFGARAAWRSLQSQLERDREDRRNVVAGRAKTVTAQWVRRWRRGEGENDLLEWGMLLRNHGTTPAFDVQVEATAMGKICTLPSVDPLQPGELFIRKDSKSPDTTYSVMRMGADVTQVEVVFKRDWLVHGVRFVLDGDTVSWRSREAPSID